MIFIDYKNNPPSEELIEEGKELTQQLLALPEDKRKEFIEQNKSYWGKLKDHLASLSYGKCWYTEAHDIASVYSCRSFPTENETKKLKKIVVLKQIIMMRLIGGWLLLGKIID